MIEGHSLLHRINHNGKSVYCGYEQTVAAKKFYELEPEGTEDNPVEWWAIIVCDDPLVRVSKKKVRTAPGGECLTLKREDT